MTAREIAWAAITLGIAGYVDSRAAWLVFAIAGAVYLAVGWVPFE